MNTTKNNKRNNIILGEKLSKKKIYKIEKNIQNISKFNILGINWYKELKNKKVFYVRK